MTGEELAQEIERVLTEKHGPLLSRSALCQALGYPSIGAFRKALSRNLVPITTFTIPRQVGRHALTKDVASWLALQRTQAEIKEKGG